MGETFQEGFGSQASQLSLDHVSDLQGGEVGVLEAF